MEAPPEGTVPYMLAQHAPPGTLLVVANEEAAQAAAAALRSLAVEDVAFLPGTDASPAAELGHDAQASGRRMALRQRLIEGRPPRVLVAAAPTLLSRWMPQEDFVAACYAVAVGDELDRAAFVAQLEACGYSRVPQVQDEGTYAVRGGVIDLYPPGAGGGRRIDLFGDTIASMQAFVPDTQQPNADCSNLVVHPIREVIFSPTTQAQATAWLQARRQEGRWPSRVLSELADKIALRQHFFGIETLSPAFYAATSAIIDSLMPNISWVVEADVGETARALAARAERDQAAQAAAAAAHRPLPPPEAYTLPEASLRAHLAARPCLRVAQLALAQGARTWAPPVAPARALVETLAAARAAGTTQDVLTPLCAHLRQARERGERVWLCCRSTGRAQSLAEMLRGRGLDVPVWPRLRAQSWASATPLAAVVMPPPGDLPAALLDRAQRLLLVADHDIFPGGRAKVAHVGGRRRAGKKALSRISTLQPGGWVIHASHGVGRYVGLTRLAVGGVESDYVQLAYAGDDKLYVPIYNVASITPFRGPAALAKADKLGGSRWLRTRQRVKDAVQQVAYELLEAQAQRRLRPGFALPAPSESYRAFVAGFPYEETPDQARAIGEVLSDLQRPTPMDRLICGDVGFGKTEVALRGIFLVVQGGRQAMVLVPTTVLAEQHRATFAERLAPYGVEVSVLSRFHSAAEQARTTERLADGRCHVVVGTHRLLSGDLAVKNLGLLVIDEEQRFGVKHKERLRQLRHDVHCLAMSATPIPRTLHMAMVGLRDLSMVQTPPTTRCAIHTEVLRDDAGVVADAIRREMRRGGQVFVVHNRVQTLAEAMRGIVDLVPEARVVAAHGQMGGPALEKVMVDFVQRHYDVLVATTIIESGIDIPSVNTLIVQRADTFGLSQLHQIRGRIGRGGERAYAYLMLPAEGDLSRLAEGRLSALKRFSELGAGFQIASEDLDLRGAGDLLGAEQSGNMQAVGLELYGELLAEAVERAQQREVRGGGRAPAVEPDLKLPVTAALPETYVRDPMQRLALYQRMAQAEDDAEVFDICGEIESLYGETPRELHNLAEAMIIRRRLRALGASAMAASLVPASLEAAPSDAQPGAPPGPVRAPQTVRCSLTFTPDSPVDRADLVRRCQVEGERFRLSPTGRLMLTLSLPATSSEAAPGPEACMPLIRHAIGDIKRV